MPVVKNFEFINFKVSVLNYSQNQLFANDSESKEIEIKPDFDVTYNKEKNSVVVDLSVNIKNKTAPFFLHVVLTGLFELKYDFSEEELDKLVKINLAAILFPFLRQVIADTTTKGGYAALLLPPINFSKAFQKAQDKKNISE